MSKDIKIKKSANITLKGTAQLIFNEIIEKTNEYALIPPNFHLVIPKLTVQEGDKVLAGDTIFISKKNNQLKFASPVSGTISEIVRGEKRKILEIRIKADDEIKFRENKNVKEISKVSREEVIEQMLEYGLWPLVNQRPFDIIANPEETPKSIFVSGFVTTPLPIDIEFTLQNKTKELQAGFDIIKKLTPGNVHLNLDKNQTNKIFDSITGVQKNLISGEHPAGNVGLQINHIDPLNKGEVIWAFTPQNLIIIGEFFLKGIFNPERKIAICGSMVEKPQYIRTRIGASIKPIISSLVNKDKKSRIILGNVFTGEASDENGHLGYYDLQISVIPNPDYHEVFGWLPFKGSFKKFSFSGTFLSWMANSKEYDLDTHEHGEHRALVMTGKYEKLFPFDILPLQLIKAILAEDIELMESLGIYEVAPEDFALLEFACTSKTALQKIVRDGLDLMIKETL